MAPEEKTFILPTGKVSALVWGPKDGYPVLAAHGWLDNAASFTPLAPLLKNLRIVAIDLPGHGHSAHRPNESYFHFVDYIVDIIALLDVLEWKTCALLGHSLGAAILTLVAGTIPERITHLGLIDALGPFSIEESRLPYLIRTGISQYQKRPHQKLPQYDQVEQAVEARLKATDMERHSVELIVKRGLKQIDEHYYWRTDSRLLFKPLIMFTESQIEVFLKDISAPTCLIRPDGGWPFKEELFASRTKLVKSLAIHRVPGKHHIHMDNPDSIAPIFQDFFPK